MSAITVAKKDFRDAIRSRTLIALTVLFALFTGGGAFVASWASELLEEGGAESTIDLVIALQTPAGLLVPIIALIVGYGAIAAERERGSVQFLLGLPHTRRDVVLGKVLGRSAVVAVSILVGFAVGLVGLVAFVGSVSLLDYAAFTLLTVLFGAVYVCIAVGISATTRSTTRAAVGVILVVLLFWMLWGMVAQLLLYVVEGSFFEALENPPDWYVSFLSLSPDAAYGSAVGAVLGETQLTMAEAYGIDDLPLLARPWVGFPVLAVWALVPLAVGLWRFSRADL